VVKWNYARGVPSRVYVACSGGVDSVAAAVILSKWRDVTLVHYHHGEHAGDHERQSVAKLAVKLNVPVIYGNYIGESIDKNREAQWRNARYAFFHSLDAPVVIAHTLDDCVEHYLITCLRGRGEYMPYQNQNCIRPFLLTAKQKLVDYCVESGVEWWCDPSNSNPDFALRNRVRSVLVPAAVACEPGLANMVRRRLIDKIRQSS
jgi:tRNA(Ile)-lysidine synthase